MRDILRRVTRALAALLPAAALVVLPKCPLCLAAWLTLVTGIGFSVTGAAWLRTSLIFFSVVLIGLAFWRGVGRKLYST